MEEDLTQRREHKLSGKLIGAWVGLISNVTFKSSGRHQNRKGFQNLILIIIKILAKLSKAGAAKSNPPPTTNPHHTKEVSYPVVPY